jgi:hypothetical protein
VQWRKRVGIVNVVMVSMKTTLRIMDALLGSFFERVHVAWSLSLLKELGVISRMIAVNVFVEPQVRLIRFQANRTQMIRSSYGSHGACGVNMLRVVYTVGDCFERCHAWVVAMQGL